MTPTEEAEAIGQTLALAVTAQGRLPTATLPLLPSAASLAASWPLTRVTLRPADSAPEPPGGTLADSEVFEVLGELGRGGMGVVLHGRQVALGREVALKRSVSSEPEHIARFLVEARVTGQLEHANIVPVHLLGRDRHGTPLLAMKRVRGRSWAQLLRLGPDARPTLGESLRVLLAVGNALSYAHGRGIVHRDVKPDNVMVGEFGEVFLVDWGLAARVGDGPGSDEVIPLLRGASGPAGTPLYMAPELARGDTAAQGPATDIYLLGGCLHEVLTGSPPHGGTTLVEVLTRALASAPVVFETGVPTELGAIRNRAMAASPADRFASVAELCAALERYLEHRATYALVDQGAHATASLARVVASLAALDPAHDHERTSLERAAHEEFTRARESLRHALASWPEAPGAREALGQAAFTMLHHAAATDDLPLARRVAPELGDDPAARSLLAALEGRVATRQRELAALRDQARRLDWSVVARPLGRVFLAGGVGGGALTGASVWIQRAGLPNAVGVAVWTLFCVALGALARQQLRALPVPDSLVSPRVVGVWAVVALGGVISIFTNEARHLPPFHDANYLMTMIGIGFASMALQTRPWLFAPALACLAGGQAMGLLPTRHALLSFGLLWMLVMGSVGVALLRGAELAPRLPDEPH